MESDDDDSDYDPTKDKTGNVSDSDDEERTLRPSEKDSLQSISFSRKRKAASIWEEINATDRSETKSLMKNSLGESKKISVSNAAMKAKKVTKILESIFGKSGTSQILLGANCNSRSNGSDGEISKDIKDRIKISVQGLQKKQTVNEVRKFAGKSIT